jgi:hypothetical protein
MQALCVRLGIAPGAAFVVAVAYGFGWHGTPGRVHILQSQHLWLPVIALALDRLRERANAGRAAVVAFVVAAALLSSYHMAVYAGVATALWGTAELVRRDAGRGRYLVAAGARGRRRRRGAHRRVAAVPRAPRRRARWRSISSLSRWKNEPSGAAGRRLPSGPPLLVQRARTSAAALRRAGQRPRVFVPIDWLASASWYARDAREALRPFSLVLPLP